METLVRLNRVEGIEEFLEAVSWHGAGVELDLTRMEEDDYREVADVLEGSPVPVGSIHYGRTDTVSLQEWELFESQLDMVTDRAARFGCSVVSVSPPRAEVNESHTVKDLQEFMEKVDGYAEAADLEICFLLDGFMKDPEMMNTAFAELEDPSLGVMVDFSRIVDGVNPVPILERLDVRVRKLKLPVPLEEVGEHLGEVAADVAVVADRV